MSRPLPGGGERLDLHEGWQLAGTEPDACSDAAEIDRLAWEPACVPGTAAGATHDDGVDPDTRDWWFRIVFEAEPVADDEEIALCLGGLATIAEVYLNGELVLESDSMFAAHELDVGDRLDGENVLAICCRALAPRLQARRTPRARWRTRLVESPNVRFYRTMLLGRAPGFAPGPAVAGPWRPVWLERRRGLMLEQVTLRARVVDGAGVIDCRAALRSPEGTPLPELLTLTCSGGAGAHAAALTVTADGEGSPARVHGTMTIDDPELWWPHTHGRPALYDISVSAAGDELHRARMGFRDLRAAGDLLADGPALEINSEPLFVRGAVWTPLSLTHPHAAGAELDRVLDQVVAAGLNMLRVPGIGTYESDEFHDGCDARGILVWQDFMFANLDYPESDPKFMATVETEARDLLARLGSRPSLAVLCGGSEVAQQVAMMGLDPALADGPLYGELLPRVVAESDVQAPYVPSSPWGGDLPFRTDRGVANYYGVGAYLRPLTDARLAEVRFAGESLAFANVPDDDALAPLVGHGGLTVYGPAWKRATPRDVGAGWDFDDVRDHYLETVFGADPAALRATDPARFLELSRAVTGEVMAETFGEWRRAGSPCAGALVLWLKDLRPGAGWGVLDHRGAPKLCLRHLARALAPVAVWSTDEGLGGVAVHVANDGCEPLRARLRVALYRDFEVRVEEVVTELELGPHGYRKVGVEELLGRFVDVSYAYRFGPPAQNLVAMSLEREGGELLSQAFRFPAGHPLAAQSLEALGLEGSIERGEHGRPQLTVRSARFAFGVRVRVPGHMPADDGFGVEPGHERVVLLEPGAAAHWPPASATLTALNLAGGDARITVAPDG